MQGRMLILVSGVQVVYVKGQALGHTQGTIDAMVTGKNIIRKTKFFKKVGVKTNSFHSL